MRVKDCHSDKLSDHYVYMVDISFVQNENQYLLLDCLKSQVRNCCTAKFFNRNIVCVPTCLPGSAPSKAERRM